MCVFYRYTSALRLGSDILKIYVAWGVVFFLHFLKVVTWYWKSYIMCSLCNMR